MYLVTEVKVNTINVFFFQKTKFLRKHTKKNKDCLFIKSNLRALAENFKRGLHLSSSRLILWNICDHIELKFKYSAKRVNVH